MLPVVLDKQGILERIRLGETEPKILAAMNIPKTEFYFALIRDEEFRKELEEAKKARAEVWFSKIADSVDNVVDKEEVPVERLKFDKLKWLAEKDNPERFGDKKTVDSTLNVNVFNIKGMSEADAIKNIQEDPFAVEAEYTVKGEDDVL